MLSARSRVCAVLSAVTLSAPLTMSPAYGADHAQDLSACAGSRPQPARSGMWDVAFCNRTDHDIVLQFHDNECPAEHWARRGDVYERILPRGAATTFPLCFADASRQPLDPPPGVPIVRIPGGKGVVTTWSVVGDCGNRSEHLYQDAKTFYDRGDYTTGILLLQYPSGASHCAADASGQSHGMQPATSTATRGSAAATAGPEAGTSSPAAAAAGSPGTASPPSAPATHSAQPSVSATTADAHPSGSGTGAMNKVQPSLRAEINTEDPLRRTVRVFATNGKGQPRYDCRIMLSLTFADGGTWSERLQTQVPSDEHDGVVATKKYFKSVSGVELMPARCSPL